jgi:hypothetical protein
MRQLLFFIFTLLLTAAIARAFDAQTNAEIDELITFVQTSSVRFIRNGTEYLEAEGAAHLRDKLAKAGDRVKTTEDFITGKPVEVDESHNASHNTTQSKSISTSKQDRSI